MDRREFIKTGTAAVAAGLLPLSLSAAEGPKSVVWQITGPPKAPLLDAAEVFPYRSMWE